MDAASVAATAFGEQISLGRGGARWRRPPPRVSLPAASAAAGASRFGCRAPPPARSRTARGACATARWPAPRCVRRRHEVLLSAA